MSYANTFKDKTIDMTGLSSWTYAFSGEFLVDTITVIGTPSADYTITIPKFIKPFIVIDKTDGGFSMTLRITGGASVILAPHNAGAAPNIYIVFYDANSNALRTIVKNKIGAKYRRSINQVYAPNVETVINFDGLIFDDLNLVTTGAGWQFLTPIDGWYNINCHIENLIGDITAISDTCLRLYQNANLLDESIFRFDNSYTIYFPLSINTCLKLNKNDIIKMKILYFSAGSITNQNINGFGYQSKIDIFLSDK